MQNRILDKMNSLFIKVQDGKAKIYNLEKFEDKKNNTISDVDLDSWHKIFSKKANNSFVKMIISGILCLIISIFLLVSFIDITIDKGIYIKVTFSWSMIITILGFIYFKRKTIDHIVKFTTFEMASALVEKVKTENNKEEITVPDEIYSSINYMKLVRGTEEPKANGEILFNSLWKIEN